MAYRFHIVVHVLPAGLASTQSSIDLAGRPMPTLNFDPAQQAPAFSFSYEQFEQRLQELPRMFCEPDGSFVWVGEACREWQIDGLIADDGRSVLHLELKGHCSPNVWRELVRQLDWPETPLMVQLVKTGVFVTEEVFCEHILALTSHSS